MKLEQPEIIQILRRRAQLNQGDFGARAFDTSFESGRTKVKNIELGRQVPTQKDLEKMAAVLGVAVSDLIPSDPPAAGAAAASDNGFRIGKALLDAFPGLEDYLGMLEKAVKVDDTELIGYIADKIARLLRQAAIPVGNARKATP
jgi:transcriptional regulator with XRE-family HTH domain